MNSPIVSWLPNYWQKGPNIDDITFADLLRHQSGFATTGSNSSYEFMRQQVAAGVPGTGGYNYENMNYGLMRILIATIGDYIDPGYEIGGVMWTDAMWDITSLAAYRDYIEDNIFAPAGVSGPGLASDGATARAYTFTGGGSWNSGDLSDFAGGAAWHMSIDELLDVAGLFRRGNAGITPGQASNFLAMNYGVDGGANTAAGAVFHKNGLWRNTNNCSGRSSEQSLLLFMPHDMELALFVNSPVGSNCTFLRDLVLTLYMNNIVEP